MTKRFELQGKKVTVTLLREGFVGQNEVAEELMLLPKESRYWLREILLCADGEPWLAGRTVVPESTLCGPELALQNLGKTPLGRYLFTSSTLTRDFIEIGRVRISRSAPYCCSGQRYGHCGWRPQACRNCGSWRYLSPAFG